MTNVLLTLVVALVVNLAVLAALKIGLRSDCTNRRGWGNHQPC